MLNHKITIFHLEITMEGNMQQVKRNKAKKYAFDWRDTPVIYVKPEESFEIETWDASTGYFQSTNDKAIPSLRPGFDKTPPLANPIAGPIFIEGAEPGDSLVVCIENITVDTYSWTAIGPNRGPLGNSTLWPDLSSEYTTKIFQHSSGPSGTTTDGTLHFSDKIKWSITPFVGTIGVAAEREVSSSADGQGDWGGNLDIRDVAPGNEIYLPVYHDGALLYLGDVHASQGDTEFTGAAAETKATVRLHLKILKGIKTPWMRIVKPNSIISIYAYRPLEVAVETATVHLMNWLVQAFDFNAVDAYALITTCPDFRINIYQMVRLGKLNYVAGAEIPKTYLQE